VQTMQTYDINSQDRPVHTTDHQRNCLRRVAATATTTATGSTMTAGPGQSFVGGLHPLCGGEGRQRRREAATRVTLCLRLCYTGPCYVVSIGSPVSLDVERKPSKYDQKKKLITSLTNRKSECDLKSC